MKMRNAGYSLLLTGFVVIVALYLYSPLATYSIWEMHTIKVSALSPASTIAIEAEMSSMASAIIAYFRLLFWPSLAMLVGGLILGRQKK